jgi:potassium efflux system protein
MAAAWPFLFVLTGWRLALFPNAGEFSQAVGDGFLITGFVLALFTFVYYGCHNRGLAPVHFRWPEPSRLTLRHHLSWLMPVYGICIFITAAIQSADKPEYGDSLGRLMFIIAMGAFALFGIKMLPVLKGSTPEFSTGATKRRIPLQFFWYPTTIGLPGLMVILAVMGYYYSALNIIPRFHETALLVIVLILGNSLVLRWLFITQRRLAYEENLQKRRERLEAESVQQSDPSYSEEQPGMEQIDIEEPEISRAEINKQTRSLLQTVLFFSALLGLWAIWNQELPALNVFEKVTLWSYSVEVDGVTRLMQVTLLNVMTAIIVAGITFVAARNLQGVLEISLLKYLPMDAGGRYAFSTICQYIVATVGIIITSNYIGISWSNLKWLVAALSVGIGFGLQEIVANFISGLIILFERPVRVGDIVTVGNIAGVVSRIRIRATTITDFDRKEYIVPNKDFITGRLLNWTLSSPVNRMVIPVGIAYGSDTEKALELLLKVAHEEPGVLEDPAPVAEFGGFGDNSLNFTVRCYLPSMKNFLGTRTALHLAIDKAFREAGITISFPQRDVHFDHKHPLEIRVLPEQEQSKSSD